MCSGLGCDVMANYAKMQPYCPHRDVTTYKVAWQAIKNKLVIRLAVKLVAINQNLVCKYHLYRHSVGLFTLVALASAV